MKLYRCAGCGEYLDEEDVGGPGGGSHEVTRWSADGVAEPGLCGPCIEQEGPPCAKVPENLQQWLLFRGSLDDESFELRTTQLDGLQARMQVTSSEAALLVETGGCSLAEITLRMEGEYEGPDANGTSSRDRAERCLRAAVAAGIVRLVENTDGDHPSDGEGEE